MKTDGYATIGGVALAVFLAVSMTATTVFATPPPDFDITGTDSSGTTLTMTVAGTAGGTTPPTGPTDDVYAYVWFMKNGDIFAVTSHGAEDYGVPGNADDITWHGHKVAGVDANGCLTGEEDRTASVGGNTVTLEGASGGKIAAAVTASFTITDEGSICLKHVWDSA